MPLAELCSFGFELLMSKALAEGLTEAFAQSKTYADYAAAREADGLA
jgi:hypothetical protein